MVNPPPTPEPKKVVTNILYHQGRVLIMKRSQQVGSFRGLWAGNSGYVEPDETIKQASLKEMEEETGFDPTRAKLLAQGDPLLVEKPHGSWLVHTHLYQVESDMVTLDWEHTAYEWVKPDQLAGFDTVPGLVELVEGLLAKAGLTE